MEEREDVEIEIRGSDDNAMAAAALKVQDALRKIDGVRNASTSIERPQHEFQVKLRPYGRDLGLTQENLASAASKKSSLMCLQPETFLRRCLQQK